MVGGKKCKCHKGEKEGEGRKEGEKGGEITQNKKVAKSDGYRRQLPNPYKYVRKRDSCVVTSSPMAHKGKMAAKRERAGEWH